MGTAPYESTRRHVVMFNVAATAMGEYNTAYYPLAGLGQSLGSTAYMTRYVTVDD